MLQNEYLCLPVGTHIPEAFHIDLDRLARWVRGRHWTDVEADLILEALLEYLGSNRPTIKSTYLRLKERFSILSECDGRNYLAPSHRDFRHLVVSLPTNLVRLCRQGTPTEGMASPTSLECR